MTGEASTAIRAATAADLDVVAEIERRSFPVPWSREIFAAELARPGAHIDVLTDAAGAVRAFSNYWVAADEIHLLKIATHPEWRRLGHGRALLLHLLARARAWRAAVVVLEVRRSNQAAQELYVREGFQVIGVRPAYYADDGEDAVAMQRRL